MQQVRFIDSNKDRSLFFATLRKNVDNYFKENNISKFSTPGMVFKTIVLMLAYFVPFALLLALQLSTGVQITMWSIMGFALAGVGMSVMHDANHGAYSSNSQTNTIIGWSLNLLGGSVFNWKMQHNLLHHTYTNVVHMDDDIDDKLILRLSPHTEVKWYHKFQFIYAFFLYGILTIYWALMKDFIQFFKYKAEGVNTNSPAKNRMIFLKILGAKALYFSIFLVLPLAILHLPVKPYIAGFLLMHFIAGNVLTIVFQLAHTVEHTTHPRPDENGTIDNAWAIHQLNTTVNFSRHNKLISWYVGGLNFQVEHHLFPTICHVHYPSIAPIVKETAEQFGIPYLENKTLLEAVGSHIRLLQRFGEPVIA